MQDYSISRAMALLWRTAPHMLLRVAVHGVLFAGLPAACMAGAGLGWALAQRGIGLDAATAMAAGAMITALLYLALLAAGRSHLAYFVTAGHLAAMIARLDGAALPGGRHQVRAGRTRVTAQFGSVARLRSYARQTGEILHTVAGLVQGVLPLRPRHRALRRVRRFHLGQVVNLIDDIVLAQALRPGRDDPYGAARLTIILYAQTARPLLLAANRMAILTWLATLVLFTLALTPARHLSTTLPGDWAGETLVLALALTWALRGALITPLATACLLQAHLYRTDGLQPNPDWEEKLDTVSPGFRALGQGEGGPPSGPSAPHMPGRAPGAGSTA